MDLAHIDHEKRDYYYYPNQNTKVEVIFRTRDDGKMEKVTRTYCLAEYLAPIAEKVRERQNWAKFGLAANNVNNKSVTSYGDEVEMEILITKPKKTGKEQKKTETETETEPIPEFQYQYQIQNMKEINKVFYIDTIKKEQAITAKETTPEQKENINETIKENSNDDNDNETLIKPKKSLVKCRHCGDSSHWSIKCPLQQKKLEDQKKEESKQKNNDVEQHRQYKNNEKHSERTKDHHHHNHQPGIALTGLKVSELDESLTEGELKAHFNQFGNIINFFMIRNKKNHKFNGIVYITYSTQKENDDALINIKRKPLNYIIPSVESAPGRREYH